MLTRLLVLATAMLLAACPEPPCVDCEPPPPDPYTEHCLGRTFDGELTSATVGEYDGSWQGFYADMPVGTLETMKIIPDQPFEVRQIKLQYAGQAGPIRVRLVETFGRSYPDLETDVFEPIEAEVAEADLREWIELELPAGEVFLEPTQHYILLSERLEGGPALALESLPEGEYSRAMMHVPGEALPYGSDGNFRAFLRGRTFCDLGAADTWFAESTDQPFAEDRSARAAITDLDGDGHDDLILNAGGPIAYLGDGAGGFTAPASDPFPEVPKAGLLVFGDVDNDGDVDAFAGTYVGVDSDDDGALLSEGDCDDGDAAVNPGATEVAGNGLDDDCDGVADDGLDDSDGDEDGVSILAGDCDDVNPETYPLAPELLDGADNDCDGEVDEDFANRMLLNDGTGQFVALDASGIEVRDPSTAAAFADADGDGLLDVYWGNWLKHYPDDPAVGDRYFHALGGGFYEDALQSAGLVLDTPLSCYGVIWNDYDNDGAQDLFVGNYHLYANQLWDNDGTGVFTDVAETVGAAFDDVPSAYAQWPGGHTYGGDFGDIDNDGDLDYYMANLAHPRVQPWSDPSMFLVNDGAPDFTFSNLREEYGFIYDEGDVNAAFADFDNDMDVDLIVASLYTGHFSRMYRNDGDAGFTDVTWMTGTAVHDSVSAVWSDVDEDGDLDLFLADRAGLPMVQLFINKVGQDKGWIELLLEGTSTNRDGIGARVVLEAGGISQMREVKGGAGHFNTQSTRIVHFGLGDSAAIDSLTVRWVGGATETITGLAPNGRYRVVEGSGTGAPL